MVVEVGHACVGLVAGRACAFSSVSDDWTEAVILVPRLRLARGNLRFVYFDASPR